MPNTRSKSQVLSNTRGRSHQPFWGHQTSLQNITSICKTKKELKNNNNNNSCNSKSQTYHNYINFNNINDLYRHIHCTYTFDIYKTFVKFSNDLKELKHAKLQLKFLLKCRHNDVFTKHILNSNHTFLNFSFHCYSINKKMKFLIQHINKKILNFEISDLYTHINYLSKIINKNTDFLKTSTHILLFQNFFHLLQDSLSTPLTRLQHTLDAKLNAILPIPITNKIFNNISQNNTPTDPTNASSILQT